MPACFQLYRKEDPTAGAVRFVEVDDKMCAHFGAPVHESNYYENWYNEVGMGLAMGHTWDKLREIYHAYPRTLAIIDYLEDNYTTNCWYESRY